MLTKITAYSQWATVPPLMLNVINVPDTDLIEVRNVDGLGPVKANVNTTPKGSVPGSMFVGSNVDFRNIVLTLGLNPDWDEWTVSRLRRMLDRYFLPEQFVRLVFETMEFSPVEISGYIEANDPNMFSKDPEHQISIICPDLYFQSVDPVVIASQTNADPVLIDYEGNVETGLHLVVSKVSGSDPSSVALVLHDPDEVAASIDTGALGYKPVDDLGNFVVNSIPGNKYIHKEVFTGGYINLFNNAVIAPRWPVIGPGTVDLAVTSFSGVQNWELTYYNIFGSL